jgi:Tfp pilus assembly protein PilO
VKQLRDKPIPRTVIFGLIALGAAVVLAGGYLLLVKPQKAKVVAIDKQIADKQATIDQYRADAAKTTTVPKIRVAEIYRLARAMPADLDMPDILLELDQVARGAGIRLQSIAPQGATPGNGFSIVPINLTFSGDYYSVTDLLYRLRSLVTVRHGALDADGRLFAVQSITLTPIGNGLQANVTVDTYLYGGTPPAAAAPAPVVTDTTSTSSSDTTSTDTSTDTTSTPPPDGASAEGAP